MGIVLHKAPFLLIRHILGFKNRISSNHFAPAELSDLFCYYYLGLMTIGCKCRVDRYIFNMSGKYSFNMHTGGIPVLILILGIMNCFTSTKWQARCCF